MDHRIIIGSVELGDMVAAGMDVTGIRGNPGLSSGPEKSSNIRYVNGSDPPTNEETIGIIRHSGPASTKYSTIEARLRTFKDWPPALKQEPRQLADAGFYYIGLSDQTKCFYCEGGLRNWQPDDDPWTEHARWFSKCGYVRLIKGDEFISKCLDERPPQTTFGPDKGSRPEQVSEEDLKKWMTSPVVTHVLNMGIDQSRIKMALKKHGKMYLEANALATAALSMQMEEQVRMIPTPESQVEPTQPARSVSAPCAPSTSVQPQNEDDNSKNSVDLEQENQRLKEARICRICMDKEISVVFLPCGHLICCVQCAPSLRDCPLCRQSIHGTVKTYMS